MTNKNKGKITVDLVIVVLCAVVFAFLIYGEYRDSLSCEEKGGHQVRIGMKFVEFEGQFSIEPIYVCEFENDEYKNSF